MTALITLKNVSARVASTPLFADLHFSLAETSRVALIGTNGVGKSTLLRVIAGLQQPERGAVIKRRDLHIAYVPQFVPHELRNVSLYEGVATYLRHRRPDLPAWSAEVALHTFPFSTAQYTVKFGALSGGEANRALLARGMVIEPDFLLLDEPTNHMDSEAIVRFEHFLHQELATPFCIVSHDRELLDNCTNETLFLRDGRISHFHLPLTPAREELRKSEAAARERLRSERKEIARWQDSVTTLAVWARQNDKFAGRLQNMKRRIEDLQRNLTFVSRQKTRALSLDVRAMQANHLLRVAEFSVTVGEGQPQGRPPGQQPCPVHGRQYPRRAVRCARSPAPPPCRQASNCIPGQDAGRNALALKTYGMCSFEWLR
jgi:ATP-binding cassette, subfamily F, member 3